MKYKNSDDNRYRVQFMRSTEELMDQLTVKEFISYLKENAEFEDYTVEYIDKKCVKCRAYKVKGALGFAYGKDRVPYDNYPAILHAGEKVLTRNQADQYERQMSTRGVQLKDVTPLDRDSSGDNSNTQVQTVQGGDAGNSKSGNWSINIGDITFPNAQMGSERDVKATADELVTEIVARLTKLSPNMT